MYEELVMEAEKENIEIIELHFRSRNICGLYSDGVIATNSNMDSKSKTITLAEELGHYHRTYGNILNQSDVTSRQEERKARSWAYKRLIGISDIVNSYNAGVRNRYELSEYLGVTEEFIEEALEYYKQTYGLYIKLDNYVVYFSPLAVLEML